MPLVTFLNWLTGKPRLIVIYLICALPAGISMAMLTPQGQVPDEPAHMARAAGLLHGAILPVRKMVMDRTLGHAKLESGVKVDTGLLVASFGEVDKQISAHTVTLQNYDDLRNAPSRPQLTFVDIPNTGPYLPTAYLPATIGLAIGLMFKASPFICMALARLGMVAAFITLSTLALWITAYGEALLITVLLMPMTLFLAGSLNQDGVLIAMSALAAAAFSRDAKRDPGLRWLGFAVLILVLCSKPPYLPLLGIALLPLRGPGFWRRGGEVAAACLPVVIWVVIVGAFVLIPYDRAPYHPGPLYLGNPNILLTATDPAANARILLAHPALLISLPAQQMEMWYRPLYDSMIGILGWLNLILPDRYYEAWSIALGSALLGLVFAYRPAGPPAGDTLVSNIFALAMIILAFWAILISLYLSWTYVGMAEIQGPQGRYFLLLLPFLLFAVPHWRGRFAVPGFLPALPAFALGLFDLGYLPLKLAIFYYAH
jgi:hypothetical protein